MFRVQFAKLCKNNLKCTISFKAPTQSSPKELFKFNMQYITVMRCITTQNIREMKGALGNVRHFPTMSLYFQPFPLKIRTFSPYKIYVL